MNRFLTICTALVLMVLALPSAHAETEVTVDGQVRVRSEVDKKEFDNDAHLKEITIMRSRLRIEATIDSNTHAIIQFQDSRTLGGNNQFGKPQSGTFNDGKNVDIHQAYIQIEKIFWDRLSTRVGRFEVNLGNQRVFGAVGWINIGRTWEGGMTWINFDKWKLTGYGLKAIEVNAFFANRDFDIYGLAANLPSIGLEIFGFIEYNAQLFSPNVNLLDRRNIGGHYKNKFERIDLELNTVYQFGDIDVRTIAAFLATAEIGYNFEGERNIRIAGGIDYASGDDGSDSTRNKSYNNLYYTGHKFRGYMDYFLSSDTEGLMDVMLRGRVDVATNWTLKADFHYFQTIENYAIGSAPFIAKDVGAEIDLQLTTTSVSGVTLQSGFSFFLPNENFALKSGFSKNDIGIWGYTQATANF